MTNYTCYPKWRDYYEIIVEFDEYRYSWAKNTPAQRKYLLESSYVNIIMELSEREWRQKLHKIIDNYK